MVLNTSDDAVFAHQGLISSGIRLSVQSDVVIPTEVEWDQWAQMSGEPRAPAVLGQPILLDSKKSVAWTLRVRRADGAVFAAGKYKISLAISLAGAFRMLDGRSGRDPAPRETDLTIVVQPPTSQRETALMHRTKGSRLLETGDTASALESFVRAVVADPGDDSNRAAVGAAYIGLNRYLEAIQVFQDLWPRYRGPRDMVPRFLALAYVGVGNDQRASEVLREAGVPQSRVVSEIAELRKRVRDRR